MRTAVGVSLIIVFELVLQDRGAETCGCAGSNASGANCRRQTVFIPLDMPGFSHRVRHQKPSPSSAPGSVLQRGFREASTHP